MEPERDKIMDKDVICSILENISRIANHQIPYYAYGDNQAACDMDLRLKEIYEIAMQHKSDIEKE